MGEIHISHSVAQNVLTIDQYMDLLSQGVEQQGDTLVGSSDIADFRALADTVGPQYARYQSGADQSSSSFERVDTERALGARTTPPERQTETAKLSGPKSAMKQIEAELKEFAFGRDDVDIQVTVFDEGGWLRQRSIGLDITAPSTTMYAIKAVLLKIVEQSKS